MHLRWLVYLRCTVNRDEVHRIGFLIVTWLHCTENHIFFFQTSWKDGFSKKSRWILKIWFSLYYQERWFFFPENMILAPDGKWKMVFLKKNRQKYDIFFKCFEKMLFSKRIAPGYDLSCTIWKGGVFFPENLVFFPWMENKRGMTFLKKYTETWYILFDMFRAPLRIKIKGDPIPQK